MKYNSLQFLAWATIGITLLAILYVAYLAFYPVKVFEINSITMTTPKVKAGSDASYHVDYCRYFEGSIHVFKSIDGPSLIYVPEAVNNNPSGCRTAEVSLNIPTYTVPGIYVIKIVAETQVNPVRKAVIRYQTDTFEVTP